MSLFGVDTSRSERGDMFMCVCAAFVLRIDIKLNRDGRMCHQEVAGNIC